MLSSSHVGPNVPGNVSKQIPGKPALSKVQLAAPQVPQHAKGNYVAKGEEKRSDADLNLGHPQVLPTVSASLLGAGKTANPPPAEVHGKHIVSIFGNF